MADHDQDIESSIEEIKTRIEQQFTDMKALPYRLAAVFIHRGKSSFPLPRHPAKHNQRNLQRT